MTPAVRVAAAFGRVVAWCVLVTLGVVVLVRVGANALPGDAAQIMAGPGAAPESVAQLRTDLGLDASVPAQILDTLGGLLRGDLGNSLVTGEPVAGTLGEALAASGWIVLPAWLIAVVVGTAAGIAAGLRGRTGRAAAFLSGVPEAVVVVLLVVVFATWAGLLPAVSLVDEGRPVWTTPGILVLPVVGLAVPAAAWVARMTIGVATDVASRRYVQDALERGVPPVRVAVRHVLPAVVPAAVQAAGLSAGALVTGSVVVERVVAYPGVGQLLASAMADRDLPVLQAAAIVGALVIAVMLACSDLAAREIDRRAHGAS